MTSVTDIGNQALLILEDQPILNIDDNTERARVIKRAYSYCLQPELRKHPWVFAITRVALSAEDATPVYGFDYQYIKPSDCLRVLRDVDGPAWTPEGIRLLSDDGPTINLRYIANVTDPNLFDPLFVAVIAAAVADQASGKITQSTRVMAKAGKAYTNAINEARRANGFEKEPVEASEDPWLAARQ